MGIDENLEERARDYAERHGLALGDQLGSGVHGSVFLTESQPERQPANVGEESLAPARSAIKVHRQEPDYCRERDIYLRLQACGLTEIHGCQVPQLIRFDNEARIIEMTVVTRPFVLDFAGAFLDRAPDFSDEVMAEWREEKREQFGDRWPEVTAVMRFLEAHGIFLVDVTPNNIVLPERPLAG